MNKYTSTTFGRGQALQRVMASSIGTTNVTRMHMANYTNEKIMEFLETLSQRYEGGQAQNLPSRNFELPLEDKECRSFNSEKHWENTEQSSSTKANIRTSKLPLKDEKLEEACRSFESEKQWVSPEVLRSRKPKIKHKGHSTTEIIPHLFTFKEEDFPPL